MFATAVSLVCLPRVHRDYFKDFYSFAQNNLQKSFIQNSHSQVCVCVCVCVFIYVRMYVCICVSVCIYVWVYVYVRMFVL